jgi:nicotinic acid mononucleotide adenylyltransferase
MADESNKDKKKKVKGFKEFDPGNYIDTEPTINEAKVGEVVISWGRMNPITTGHEKLINRVLNVAKSKNAIPAVFLTHSQDKIKNPLSYNDKIRYAEVAFGKIIQRSTAKTIIQLMQQLQKKFKKVTLVVGSDRYKEMDTLLNKYNGKEYKFDEIEVVSAGARDPDAEGVKGMSASKMREYAVSDNIKKFTTGLPSKLKTSAADIMASIKKGMGMSEEYSEDNFIEEDELDEALTRQQRIKRGRQMRRMRVKMKRGREKASRRRANIDVLKRRSRKAARNIIKTRLAGNKRYADMEPAEKERIDKRIEKISKQRIDNLAIKLLPSVKKKERERLQARHGKNESVDLNEMWGAYVTKRPHMLMDKNNKPKFDKRFKMFKPKQVTEMNEFDIEDIVELMESVEKFTETTGKYYTGVAKNKKDDREDHFERNAKKADDDPSAYRPAPGDKEAKTKESKHTKKARAMGYTEEFDFLGEDAAGKSLADKAKKSGMPAGILRKVYNRGVAAWKTGHRPGTTPEQWGHARVNSFITKSSGTWGKADSDLAAKVRKEEVELDEAPRRKGAPKMTGDSIAIQRAKDAEHAKAMGRSVKTGRKLPKKTMTSTQRSLASLRGEGNEQMPKTYKNIIEAATPQMKKAAASIEAYAKKSGGIDKADFMKAAKMLSSGNAGSNFVKFVMYLDTEPREWLIMDLAKTMGKQTVEKMFKVKIRESVNEATAAKPKNNKAERERRLAQNMKKLKDMRKSDKSWGKSSAFDYHEEVELDETLSPSEKKLVNQMYDKKGNLTAIGKKVMNHGKKPGDKGYVESLDDRFEAFMAESIDEVLDTPKAMDSYRNKAKYSKDKAVNSALATALRGDGDGKKDLKTMSKRAKGLKMADRNATNKTVKALRAGYSEDLDEDAKMKKQSDDNLKSLHKQFKGQDQKMPSTQHMMKRITKEMKRRNMSESEEAAKLASVANGGVQDKEEKFKNALSRVRNKKSMKDESSCGSSKKRNEEAGAGEEGTAKLVKRLKKDTPNA